MVAYDVVLDAMGIIVGMVALVMLLGMNLVLIRGLLLLLVVVQHRAQCALPGGRAIETRVMPLLMSLTVHAPSVLTRRVRAWGFGRGRWFARKVA